MSDKEVIEPPPRFAWFARSVSDLDCHYGEFSLGQVTANCRVGVFEPVRNPITRRVVWWSDLLQTEPGHACQACRESWQEKRNAAKKKSGGDAS
jgi:hypothetical protein